MCRECSALENNNRFAHLFSGLRFFHPIFTATLATCLHAYGIEPTTYNMIANARQAFHAPTTNHNYRVLLTMVHTPRLNGDGKCVGLFLMTLKPRAKATERDLRLINVRPLRTSWFIVDMPKIKEA